MRYRLSSNITERTFSRLSLFTTLCLMLLEPGDARAQTPPEAPPGSTSELPQPVDVNDVPPADGGAPTGEGVQASAQTDATGSSAMIQTPPDVEAPPASDVLASPEAPNRAPLRLDSSTTPVPIEPGPEAEGPAFKVSGAPGQGLTVSTGEAFSLNIKSRVQLRYQVNVFEDSSKDTQALANIGTARIWLGGNVYKPELTYLIQLAIAGKDYRDNATSPIYDAYLEWKAHRDFSVRAGQYFVPFDRLRTVREWGLQMTERPRPIQEFTLDRDVGVTFFSEKFLGDSSPVAWYLSAFGGHGTNQVNTSAVGGLITGRLELRPLGPIDDDREGDLDRRQKPGLAIGGGAAHNFGSGRLRGTTGPAFVGGTSDDTYFAVDAMFKWMGLALEAEYLHKSTTSAVFVSEQADGSTLTEHTREGSGWVVQASYAFDPPFEVVGRLSRLYSDDTQDPVFISEVKRRGSEVAGGLNYYFNGHRMKAQATWVARTSSELDLGAADHSIVAQLDATF